MQTLCKPSKFSYNREHFLKNDAFSQNTIIDSLFHYFLCTYACYLLETCHNL